MSTSRAWSGDAPVANGVHLLSGPSAFEEHYGAVRAKEGRILADDQVRQLPNGQDLWNAEEWRIRSRSVERLMQHLAKRGPSLHILEVGCGNGWLSALLQRNGHQVLGIDPFTEELEQAARVFRSGPVFARADLFTSPLNAGAFDVIVFAASIQYFADAAGAVRRATELLAPGGEVHVLDTVLYREEAEAQAALQRSRAYYTGLGFPEMTDHYHAHTQRALEQSGRCVVLDKPASRLVRWLGRSSSPFTHVVITR